MKTTIATARPADSAALTFRQHLQGELARRCAGNPRYSLRAFAKWLGTDHATLSQMLRGGRKITVTTMRRFGARLKLKAGVIDGFIAAEREHRSDVAVPPALREARQLTADAAGLLGDWYHFAILELVRLDGFRPDSRWIARVLGITTDEVNVALQRLLHLGLLRMESREKWSDTSGHALLTVADFTQRTIQRLIEQTRGLSMQALTHAPAELREFSATTLAVDTARLPQAIDRIARFRRDMMALLEHDGARDDVYQLEINLFPITRLNKEQLHGQSRRSMADAEQSTR